MAENASPHPPSNQISFPACSPKNLLKQSCEIPAETTQVLIHGISAIAAAKTNRLQGKEYLLLIAEEEKQNMIVDQPPNLQTSTSYSLAQSKFAPKTSDSTPQLDSDDLPTARMPYPGDLETALGQTGVTRLLCRSAHCYVAFNLRTHETPPRARKERLISFIIKYLLPSYE